MKKMFKGLKKMCCGDREDYKQYTQVDMLSQQENFLSPKIQILGSEDSGKNEFIEIIQNQQIDKNFTSIRFQEKTYHFDVTVKLNNKQKTDFKVFSINEQYSLQTSQITQFNIDSMNGVIIIFSLNSLKSYQTANYYIEKVQKSINQGNSKPKVVTILGIKKQPENFFEQSQISNSSKSTTNNNQNNKNNNNNQSDIISEEQLLKFKSIDNIIENAQYYEIDIKNEKGIKEIFRSRSLMTYKYQKQAGAVSQIQQNSHYSKYKQGSRIPNQFQKSIQSDRSSQITIDCTPQQLITQDQQI